MYRGNMLSSSLETDGAMGEGVTQREGKGRESKEHYFFISMLQ